MTPKEKANEIASRMLARCFQYDVHINVAKECALVTVDEILKSFPTFPTLKDEVFEHSIDELISAEDYWHEVKKQIEQL